MVKYEEHFGINIISTNLNNSTDVDFLTEDIVNDVEKFHSSIDVWNFSTHLLMSIKKHHLLN